APSIRLLEALIGVDGVVAEPAVVADEVPLRLRIETRTQPIDNALVGVQINAATGAAIRTDAFLLLEEPDTLLVEKVLAAQGADRTKIDDIGRQFVVERDAGEGINLLVIATVGDLQFGLAADLPREADTAR